MKSPHLLSARNLTVGYRLPGGRTRIVLERIDVDVDPGEVVCLIGANGSGKSTLLRSLGAMQPLIGGTVEVGGAELCRMRAGERARLVSLVLTERFDAGYLDVYTLVSLGRHPYTNWTGTLESTDHAQVQQALSQVGISHLASRSLPELSDGERQKTMIARALAQDTPLIILDEPTAYLDVTARADIMQLLHDLASDTGKCFLLSTHDLEFALRSADRMLMIREPGLLEVGAPEDLVLNGSFAAAFRDQHVEFDSTRALFVLRRPARGTVELSATGNARDIALTWTANAFERIGYTGMGDTEMSDGRHRLRVKIEPDGDGFRWVVSTGSAPTKFRTFGLLYELVSFVKRLPVSDV